MVATQLKALAGALSLLLALSLAAAPDIDPARDTDYFGAPDDVLFWTPSQQVAGYRHSREIFWTRDISAGDHTLELPLSLQDLDGLDVGGLTLADYIARRDVAGLLVIKDGSIVYERYALGNDAQTPWVSFSVAKSLSSLLVGAAIRDGHIGSVDDRVTEYLPALRGSAYEQVSVRQLLQMASGVAWDETYADRDADINRIHWATEPAHDYLQQLPRAAAPGTRFNYNTAESNLVGDLVSAAVGEPLATYTSEKIWRPFGMGQAGSWNLVEEGGNEFGGSSFNATLRDYGRLGLFALAEGELPDGSRVLPPGWLSQSTTPSKTNPRYGYLWWLNPDGSYQAAGVFGQAIHINPAENLVIALHSAWPVSFNEDYTGARDRMFSAITRALAGSGAR